MSAALVVLLCGWNGTRSADRVYCCDRRIFDGAFVLVVRLLFFLAQQQKLNTNCKSTEEFLCFAVKRYAWGLESVAIQIGLLSSSSFFCDLRG